MIVKERHESRDTASFLFDTYMMNYRHGTVDGELTFAVGDVVNRQSFEFEPREYKQTYTSFGLGPGEHEWTATIGEDSITGRVRVVSEDGDC